MSIGKNIKELRLQHNMSQLEFAKVIGVTDKAVSSWENGIKTPRMGTLQRIADYFNIKKSEIIEGPLSLILESKPNVPTEAELKQEALNRVISRDRATSPPSGLTAKEERDIESDLEDMMNSMASAAYEGNTEAEEDVEALKATLKAAMIQAKKVAKKKYTPKKYRRD